mgnify:FL=1
MPLMPKAQIYLIGIVELIVFASFAYQMVVSPSWLNFAVLIVMGISILQLKGPLDKAIEKEKKQKGSSHS